MPKKRTKLTKEMIADLHAVFKKHNWAGFPVGMQEIERGGHAMADAPCPDGQTLQTFTVLRPDGTTEVRTICI